MSYWLREVFGWALMASGLAVFFLVMLHLLDGRVYATVNMTIVGVFLFRGGIHLLKVALAARVCEQAALALRTPPPPLARAKRPARLTP